jgi:uncharacterized membrane protein YbaN (DUF454 family)
MPFLPTRALWLIGGWLAVVIGLIGVVLPLLPTTPFLLVAAWCFSRGSPRIERWLLNHPRLGPSVREWRAHRAVPLPAKQLATLMMATSSLAAFFVLPPAWCWMPAAFCAVAAAILWRLPTSRPRRADR